jgi:fucose permease
MLGGAQSCFYNYMNIIHQNSVTWVDKRKFSFFILLLNLKNHAHKFIKYIFFIAINHMLMWELACAINWENFLLRNIIYKFYQQLNRSHISWITSAFPLGIVIMSIIFSQIYYWIGTKLSLIISSFLLIISWLVILLPG